MFKKSKLFFLMFSIPSFLHCALSIPCVLQLEAKQRKRKEDLNAQLLQVAGSKEYNAQKKITELTTLLDTKASIDTENEYGETALYRAICCAGFNKREDNSVIQLLIDRRSQVDNGTNNLFPLERAIAFKMFPVIAMLVNAGADVNTPFNSMGTTPLLMLAKLNNGLNDEQSCRAFQLLTKSNIKDVAVDATEFYSHTAACLATQCSSSVIHKKKLIKALFLHGASPYCPKKTCKTDSSTFDSETWAAHEMWKRDAANAVTRYITVRAVVDNIVMGYCFSPFKK